jgi:putative flippase GtrA
VSCPSLLRRPAVPGELPEELPRALVPAVRSGAGRLVARLRRDDATAQFGRFVFVGGVSTLLYAIVFLCSRPLGDQAGNVIGSVLSSMLANELHRRLTFRAEGRVSWFAAQWEGGTVALVGIVATALALGWFDAVTGADDTWDRLLVVGVVTGAIGLMRFVALRWLFTPRARRNA